ncbi:DUF2147 domain-containing protein [Winogradskyella sp.]|uniref:DUF2147 domain-containing protein n=1 Tax=Winogradskyella sp. TaxID=1883156 RepID=UPI0026009167|nr:DUF2147 domain-containing protein [Winogradskyella sp.]
MKTNKHILTVFLFLITMSLTSQNILGKWKTIDDKTREEKSIVDIYEYEGKIYGIIIEILNTKNKNALCEKCKGDKKDKPILTMMIIDGLTKDDDAFGGGTILDPENGKTYKCRLKLDEDDKDTLQVRGYVAFFYKTQYWKRVVK